MAETIAEQGVLKQHAFGMIKNRLRFESVRAGEDGLLLRDLKRPIIFVQEDDLLPDIFSTLIEKRARIAAVVNAFGGTSGVLSMEGVVETLLGL